MPSRSDDRQARRRTVFVFLVSGLSIFGFLDTCNDRLVEVTRFIDPCGTVLFNCVPGDFETFAADVGDFCVDPACTVPGQCGNIGPALGTVTNVCP